MVTAFKTVRQLTDSFGLIACRLVFGCNKMRDYWGDRKFKFNQKTLGDLYLQKRTEEKAKNTLYPHE